MKLAVSAPGRICLFGEHQDYFGFPVVASAIDLRISIQSTSRLDREVHVDLIDLDEQRVYNLDALPAPQPRDYLLIALHLADREGWLPQSGWHAIVSSQIPMCAGASSSSALLVAWCALIAERSDRNWNQAWIAKAAWRAEVDWFGEPGGMMDQTVCALGGTQHIAFRPAFQSTPLPTPPGSWLLFDSKQPKDTLGVLSRAKDCRLELIQNWECQGTIDWAQRPPQFPQQWNDLEQHLMMTTLEIRRISHEGAEALKFAVPDLRQVGALLHEHHHWLSEGIEVSTPRIDGILTQECEAGALGGKINGSGGGGTGFVVCEASRQSAVAEAIERAKGHPMFIALGAEGVRLEEFIK